MNLSINPNLTPTNYTANQNNMNKNQKNLKFGSRSFSRAVFEAIPALKEKHTVGKILEEFLLPSGIRNGIKKLMGDNVVVVSDQEYAIARGAYSFSFPAINSILTNLVTEAKSCSLEDAKVYDEAVRLYKIEKGALNKKLSALETDKAFTDNVFGL